MGIWINITLPDLKFVWHMVQGIFYIEHNVNENLKLKFDDYKYYHKITKFNNVKLKTRKETYSIFLQLLITHMLFIEGWNGHT
jgi:hypothetical protein